MALVCEDLRILRNGVYARHGYVFGNEWVREHMLRDPEYKPDPTINEQTVGERLTDVDRTTAELILQMESEYGCHEYWRELESKGDESVEGSAPATDSPPKPEEPQREFAKLSEVPTTGSNGRPSLMQGYAIPAFVIDTATYGEVVQNEWLPPLTCDELARVEQGVYARYNVWFQAEDDRAFFASILYGYTPKEGTTPASVEPTLQNVDRLNLLRVNRAQGSKGCK
ncbi:YARHG domain-containing protein [Candidatus Uhrbacteria bacterium]|nr:YARHG domain-containing protein [Candidatus Uhrbacteria bacterium]